ncbi:MAG: hypothetical protein AAGF47_00210 [Planctomycetota bacterium]
MTRPAMMLVMCVLAALCCARSAGQLDETRGAVGSGSADGAGHAWVVVPVPEPDDGDEEDTNRAPGLRVGGALLRHVPPRLGDGVALPAPDGRLAAAARLGEAPGWLAASGNAVFAMTKDEDSGRWSVGQLRAEPRGYRDLWQYLPDRRLRILPAFEAGGELLGVAALDGRLHVLERDDNGVRRLWRLDRRGWVQVVELPNAPDGEPTRQALFADEFGLAVVEVVGDAVRLTRFEPSGESGSVRVEWESRVAGLPSAARIVGLWRGEVVVREPAGPEATAVSLVSTRGRVPLAELAAPERAGFAVIGTTGRLVAVWSDSRETDELGSGLPTPGANLPISRIAELSLVTGRVLFEGDGRGAAPVSQSEFRILALLLFLMMAVMLVVVLRPMPSGEVIMLPPGTSLAPGGRRLLATVLDLTLGVLIASRLTGVTVLEAFGPLTMPLTGQFSVLPLVLTLGLTAAHSAAGEAILGRSLGKLATGLFVARVDTGPQGTPEPGVFRAPTLGGAILRNIVKWLLPPAAALALSDPDGRHRGDAMARTAVLVAHPLEN